MTGFVVPGEPQPKERARTTSHGSYTPDRTRRAEEATGWAFRAAGGRTAPPEASVRLVVTYILGHRRRRDLDNLLKLTMDGLIGHGLAYKDDSQVTEVHAMKRWVEPGEVPHTEVVIDWT